MTLNPTSLDLSRIFFNSGANSGLDLMDDARCLLIHPNLMNISLDSFLFSVVHFEFPSVSSNEHGANSVENPSKVTHLICICSRCHPSIINESSQGWDGETGRATCKTAEASSRKLRRALPRTGHRRPITRLPADKQRAQGLRVAQEEEEEGEGKEKEEKEEKEEGSSGGGFWLE